MLKNNDGIVKKLGINFNKEIYENFLFDSYISFLKIQGLTYDTQQFYLNYINRFIVINKFDSIDCFDNLLKLKIGYNNLPNRGISNNTVNKYYLSIVKYSYFLIDNELIKNKYYSKLQKVKLTKSLPKALSENEIEILNKYFLQSNPNCDFFKFRNYAIFQTFLNTGIRRSELVNLKKENVYSKYIIVVGGKGNKDRIVYISNDFSNFIFDYIKIQKINNEYVFCDINGDKLNKESLSKFFFRIKKKLGIGIHAHIIRHTYASLCIKKGVNLYTVQQQLGHNDLKTTSIYLYLNSDEQWKEIQKLKI